MSTGSSKRNRSDLALPPGTYARILQQLRRSEVLGRIGLCFLTAVFLWAVTGAWAPPFPYRSRYVPSRDIVSRVDFSVVDEQATNTARSNAHRDVVRFYDNDVKPLDELQSELLERVFQVVNSESFSKVDQPVWQQFLAEGQRDNLQVSQTEFGKFQASLTNDEDLTKLKRAVQVTLDEFRPNGLIDKLDDEREQGSLTEINVINPVDPNSHRRVGASQVLIRDVTDRLRIKLREEVAAAQMTGEYREELAERLFTWMRPRLPVTLSLNVEETKSAANAAAEAVEDQLIIYAQGDKLRGIESGKPLTDANILLLQAEHAAFITQLNLWELITYSLADLGMYAALCVLCGFFVYYREPRIYREISRLMILLGSVIASVTVACFLPSAWRAEVMPIAMFAMAMSIAYRYELALLLASSVSLITAISLGAGLANAVIFVATSAAASFLCISIRSRTKLIYVGLCAGAVAMLTSLGVQTLSGQPLSMELVKDSGLYGIWAVVAALLMTALLPFVEKMFDVQTGISLLELGDAAHPLLQELVRRAPGTYNHSINVASIAEAAAEAIGANGLLVRVGAYFHDIGKMLKPSYFIENQEMGANKHQSLVPAMSTLVIIAHVKDGAELARKHRLPQSIIDFIEQHHGTTLVEYFYREAEKQREQNPESAEVDESSFRYPGPKPQTREAGAMMLADASESASRTLVDPTPSRIEHLVRDIAMKRLNDGQFDECGLTLSELHIIQESLIKSLIAVYHGRVKYPDQQTA